LSTMLQAYSSLPFNVISGVTTVQGTTGRPVVNGEYIPRNSGELSAFFAWSLRVSRDFRFGSRTRIQGLVEAFNLTNHTNVVTVNNNFGTGIYPANPLPTFGQVTAVGDPRSFQLGLRVSF
jgi:outer membrane receptor for Fe3+-dicitrate